MGGDLFYIRFVICLSIGLVGLGMILMRLLDTLFNDWDAVADLKLVLQRPSRLQRDEVSLDFEESDAKPQKLVTRLYRDEMSGRADAPQASQAQPRPDLSVLLAPEEPEPNLSPAE